MPKTVSIDRETLLELYVNKGFTLKEVCIATGIKSDITIVKYMKKYGIDRRDTNTERSLVHNLTISEEEFKKELLDSYLNENVSVLELGKKYKFSHTIIKKYLLKYGANIRNNKEAMKLNSGSKNHKWNEGMRFHSAGYKQLYMPNHPNAIEGRYVYEHRYLMEQKIGRLLETNEHVHHINGNKADNRIKNLQLLSSSEHPRLHGKKVGKEIHRIMIEGKLKKKHKNQIEFEV